MDNWDEIKTAFHVARLGTVSGAAEALGVHHATVIRHIDALEGRMKVKLFQRHARGYTPTEAGQDLLRVAAVADDQFSQLAGRIKGRGADVSGDLVVTSLDALAPRLVPLLVAFQQKHPQVLVRYLTGERLFRLEYAEAHVAIRAGAAPSQPDNVVQPFYHTRVGLFASQGYLDAHGAPKGQEDFANHRFIGHDSDDNRAPFYQWMRAHVPESAVTFRATDSSALEVALLAGAGIGFMSLEEAARHETLVEVHPREADWAAPLWLVTHVDLHRTMKVQSLLSFLKAHTKGWDA